MSYVHNPISLGSVSRLLLERSNNFNCVNCPIPSIWLSRFSDSFSSCSDLIEKMVLSNVFNSHPARDNDFR